MNRVFGLRTRLLFTISLAGGFSVEVPFKQNGPSIGIDYSYRASDLNMYNGTHSIGLRFDLRSGSPCDLDNKDEARAL